MKEKLRNLAKQKIDLYKKQNNINEVNRFEIILKILEDDNCFKLVDEKTAYSILLDLGFTKEETFKIYNDIIYSEI